MTIPLLKADDYAAGKVADIRVKGLFKREKEQASLHLRYVNV